jgi:hypothetical protein
VAYNYQDILDAIEQTLKNDSELRGVNIRQAVRRNADPDLCPWIGLNLIRGTFDPYTIAARNQPWKVLGTVLIVLQTANLFSGEDAQRALFDLLKKVITAIGNNPDLTNETGTHVVRMTGPVEFEVNYVETTEPAITYFVSADLILSIEARA